MKENNGLDTETYQGYVKLICDDKGDFKEIDSFGDCLQFLTQSKFRNCYNWFYNIQFDFESIIKYLDYRELVTLYHEHKLQYDKNFMIEYIPKKYFVIKTSDNHRYYFYDMANFLEGGLNRNAIKILHDKKESNIDAEKLNLDLDYWKENKDDIIKYCIKDAVLTKQLADYFWNIIYTNLSFYPKSPMSKGKLSEEYFSHNCNIPSINSIPEKVLEISYNSFYGGRFELLKRGYQEHVYNFDIKSAYPKIISELIDYTKGKWEKTDKLNPDAHTGFYKCEVECLEENFSPFMKKIKTLNVFPNGCFNLFLAKEEIDFIESRFENSRIKIVFGYEFTPKTIELPFKSEIERLYDWKEKEQNPDIKYAVKIILNSLYGKFIQVVGETNQTGKLFNPIYAAKITAGTRIKILELALQSPENIISFSTDSVCSQIKLKTPNNPQLGEFQQDFEGEGVFVMSDVYNLWNDKTKKVKTKLRGFALASTKDIDEKEIYLKDILKNMGNDKIYTYFSKRPDHLGECIAHRKSKTIKDNLNVFSNHEKSIDINGDKKREWDKDFISAKEVLTEYHESKPVLLGV